MIRFLLLALLALATPAIAADLTITRTTTIVADQVNALNPKALPGSTVDYALTVTNPLGNAGQAVRGVQIVDLIPAGTKLRVADIATAGKGPIEYLTGLPTTVIASGLSYAYATPDLNNDGLEYRIAGVWVQTAADDGTGYNANVTAIRVTLTGTQMTTGGSFRLRYRVAVK